MQLHRALSVIVKRKMRGRKEPVLGRRADRARVDVSCKYKSLMLVRLEFIRLNCSAIETLPRFHRVELITGRVALCFISEFNLRSYLIDASRS